MKSQIQCPNCNSFKTMSSKLFTFAMGLTSAGCVGPIFMVLLFPLGIILALVGLSMIVASPFLKKGDYFCQSCHLKFKSKEVNL